MEVLAQARERLERQEATVARGFGGRRTGFVADEAEQLRMVELDRRLFELVRRAVSKHR